MQAGTLQAGSFSATLRLSPFWRPTFVPLEKRAQPQLIHPEGVLCKLRLRGGIEGGQGAEG